MPILKNPNHIGLVFEISKYILHKERKIKLILSVKTKNETMKNWKFWDYISKEAHWNELLCLEKAWIKKWKTSSSRNMIFIGDDVFWSAKFFTIIHINSFQYEKCVFLKLKILWNFLSNLCKKRGFWISFVDNFSVCSSIILHCIPSVRTFPIWFLALKNEMMGLNQKLWKKVVKQFFADLR